MLHLDRVLTEVKIPIKECSLLTVVMTFHLRVYVFYAINLLRAFGS